MFLRPSRISVECCRIRRPDSVILSEAKNLVSFRSPWAKGRDGLKPRRYSPKVPPGLIDESWPLFLIADR